MFQSRSRIRTNTNQQFKESGNMRLILFCLAITLLVLSLNTTMTRAAFGSGADVESVSESPNIIILFVDDMGYADIEPFGNTEVRTPHLSRLADQGRKFTSFYAAPVCSMSRTNLLTGCYNARVSMPGVLFPNSDVGLAPEEMTIAEVLREKGYVTACVGKWHLGDAPKLMPLAQGFDRYFGLPYSNDMTAGRKGKNGVMPPLPLYRNTEVLETEPDQSQLTRRYTDEAIEFIRESVAAKAKRPFFLYLPHTMIHFPLAASSDFKDKSKLGLIGDTIEEIDWSVGRILQTLQECDIDNDTLVIFTTDNGPARRGAPPLRGNKGTNYEGGVRVPTIMRWPGHVPEGTQCDQICGTIDLLPTLAMIANAPMDSSRVIDGKDITLLLTSKNPSPVRDTHLYFSATQQLVAIRQGDWKLFVRNQRPAKGNSRELYNLKDDIGESHNIAEDHPELVQRLLEQATKLEAEINAHKRPAGKS